MANTRKRVTELEQALKNASLHATKQRNNYLTLEENFRQQLKQIEALQKQLNEANREKEESKSTLQQVLENANIQTTKLQNEVNELTSERNALVDRVQETEERYQENLDNLEQTYKAVNTQEKVHVEQKLELIKQIDQLTTVKYNLQKNLENQEKVVDGLLHLVCQQENAELVEDVLEQFPKDLNARDVLISAYENTEFALNKSLIANYLLFQGAKQNSIVDMDKALSLGADINAQNKKNKETALHKATFSGHEEAVAYLLEKNCSVLIRDRNRQLASEVTSTKSLKDLILPVQQKQETIQKEQAATLIQSAFRKQQAQKAAQAKTDAVKVLQNAIKNGSNLFAPKPDVLGDEVVTPSSFVIRKVQ